MSATVTYSLSDAVKLLKGYGAVPFFFGEPEEAWCCYGRTPAAGLITILFGRSPASVTIGSETYAAGDSSLGDLMALHLPTQAKLDAAQYEAEAPRKKAPPKKWVKSRAAEAQIKPREHLVSEGPHKKGPKSEKHRNDIAFIIENQ